MLKTQAVATIVEELFRLDTKKEGKISLPQWLEGVNTNVTVRSIIDPQSKKLLIILTCSNALFNSLSLSTVIALKSCFNCN